MGGQGLLLEAFGKSVSKVHGLGAHKDILNGHQSLSALHVKKRIDMNLTTPWRILGHRQMPEWNLLMIIPPGLDLLGTAIVCQQENSIVGIMPKVPVTLSSCIDCSSGSLFQHASYHLV
ncbi:uncharacterized protein M8220_010657 [Acridotheres tristis]